MPSHSALVPSKLFSSSRSWVSSFVNIVSEWLLELITELVILLVANRKSHRTGAWLRAHLVTIGRTRSVVATIVVMILMSVDWSWVLGSLVVHRWGREGLSILGFHFLSKNSGLALYPLSLYKVLVFDGNYSICRYLVSENDKPESSWDVWFVLVNYPAAFDLTESAEVVFEMASSKRSLYLPCTLKEYLQRISSLSFHH